MKRRSFLKSAIALIGAMMIPTVAIAKGGRKMTICKKCKWVYNREDGPRTSVWYNWFCKHPDVRRVKAINPVTGNEEFKSKNDLGQEYLTGQEYPFCRDINNGSCQCYKEK